MQKYAQLLQIHWNEKNLSNWEVYVCLKPSESTCICQSYNKMFKIYGQPGPKIMLSIYNYFGDKSGSEKSLCIAKLIEYEFEFSYQ